MTDQDHADALQAAAHVLSEAWAAASEAGLDVELTAHHPKDWMGAGRSESWRIDPPHVSVKVKRITVIAAGSIFPEVRFETAIANSGRTTVQGP